MSYAQEYPNGITSFEPVPYGYRRWNGSAWPDSFVDWYNAELSRLETRHLAGYNVSALVAGLHNLAEQFDYS